MLQHDRTFEGRTKTQMFHLKYHQSPLHGRGRRTDYSARVLHVWYNSSIVEYIDGSVMIMSYRSIRFSRIGFLLAVRAWPLPLFSLLCGYYSNRLSTEHCARLYVMQWNQMIHILCGDGKNVWW